MPRSAAARRRALVTIAGGALAFASLTAGLSASAPEEPGTPRFVQRTLGPIGPTWRHGVASMYDDVGQRLACGGRLGADQLGVASRTHACGTLVTFLYRGRSVRVPVIDRGPYVRGRMWDLTVATARALRFPGLATVTWRR